jgi:hypothetical protein
MHWSTCPASYTRYLERYFLEAFKLQGTPLRIQYKTSKNPFAVDGRPAESSGAKSESRRWWHGEVKSITVIHSKTNNPQRINQNEQ